MEDIKKLLGKITVKNVNKKMEDGWTNPSFIAKYIVGIDVWRSLSEDNQRVLIYYVDKIVKENRPLIYI